MIKEYNDSTWQGKAYSKIVDTTQQVTSFPVVVRPMENAIPSWTIKGNMVQDGTPSPSNIIYPSETGERTGNLFDYKTAYTSYLQPDGTIIGTAQQLASISNSLANFVGRTVTISIYCSNVSATRLQITAKENGVTKLSNSVYRGNSGYLTLTITPALSTDYWAITYGDTGTNEILSQFMLNTGSTALPYQPYGYKLDIKSGNTTTPVYLGEVQTTRKTGQKILKGDENITYNAVGGHSRFNILGLYATSNYQIGYCSHYNYQYANQNYNIYHSSNNSDTNIYIFDDNYTSAADFKTYLAQQYANGTPVCVWYVLANETTTTLNEPLRKIGDYADSVSGTNLAVTAQSPTTIDVDTLLKPSEMDLTYTGKKMCKRKKAVRTANIYNKYNTIDIPNFGVRYGVYCELGNYAIYNDTDNNVYWFTDNGVARFLACSPHSTSTVSISGSGLTGFYMPYNDSSLGEVTIVQGSTVPDHYIPYLDWS